MRFVEFYIRQFGLLREVGGSFSPGLSLIVGENESGKTTLMNFFRYCLFNFPHGRSNRNFYLPPDGRAQQGQLIVETTNGVSLAFEMNGRKINVSGQGEGINVDALLGYLDRETYERVFAVGLEDMQQIKTLNDQTIQSRFFAAGAGLGTASLPCLVETLSSKQKKLYHPEARSRNSAIINGLLQKLRQIDEEIKVLQQQKSEFIKMQTMLRDQEKRIESVRKELEEKRSTLSLYEWIEKARTPWIEMEESQKKLHALGEISSFPKDGLTHLATITEEIKNKEQECRELQNEEEHFLEVLQSLERKPFRGVLEKKGEIRSAVQNRGRIEREEEALRTLEGEIASMRHELEKELSNLYQGWPLEHLYNIDLSFNVCKYAHDLQSRQEEIRSQIAARQEALIQARLEMEKAADTERELYKKAEEACLSTPPLSEETLREERGHLRQTFLCCNQARLALQELQTSSRSSQPVSKQWVLSTVVTGVMLFLGVAFLWKGFGEKVPFEMIIGGALCFLGTAAFLGNCYDRNVKEKEKRSYRLKLQEEWEESKEILNGILQNLHIKEPLESYAQLENIEALIDSYLDCLKQKDQCVADWEAAQKARERRQLLYDEGEKALKGFLVLQEGIKEAWQELVESSKLPPSLELCHFVEFEGRVKQLRQHGDRIKEAEKKLSFAASYLESRLIEIKELCLGIAPEKNEISTYREIVPTIDFLSSILDESMNLQEKFSRLHENKEQCSRRRKSAEEELQQYISRKETLLREADACNEEVFYQKGIRWQESQKLKYAIENYRLSLLTIAGGEGNLPLLIKELEERTPAESHTLYMESKEKERTLSLLLEELNEELGTIKSRMQKIEKDKELSAILFQKECLIEQSKQNLKKWMSTVLCRYILEQTRRKHEKERQPEVIRKASDFLQLMTHGRYSLISSSLGQGGFSIELEEEKEKWRKTEEIWSNGLADQVYLALRLALSDLYGKRSEPLPLILDDVLVRFDEKRQLGAAKALLDAACKTQILLFSCRKELIRIFHELDGQKNNFVKVFSLAEGRLQCLI